MEAVSSHDFAWFLQFADGFLRKHYVSCCLRGRDVRGLSKTDPENLPNQGRIIPLKEILCKANFEIPPTCILENVVFGTAGAQTYFFSTVPPLFLQLRPGGFRKVPVKVEFQKIRHLTADATI